MTDDRPRPRYGEYADAPPASASQPTLEPAAAVAPPEPAAAPPEPAERPRRTWDVLLASLLLLWGAFDVATGLPAFASLGSTIAAAARQQGIDGFASAGLADEVGVWLNVARIVLFALAVLGTLLLLGRRRLAFWAPLAAGALAVLIAVVCIGAILLGDPGFAAYVSEQAAKP